MKRQQCHSKLEYRSPITIHTVDDRNLALPRIRNRHNSHVTEMILGGVFVPMFSFAQNCSFLV